MFSKLLHLPLGCGARPDFPASLVVRCVKWHWAQIGRIIYGLATPWENPNAEEYIDLWKLCWKLRSHKMEGARNPAEKINWILCEWLKKKTKKPCLWAVIYFAVFLLWLKQLSLIQISGVFSAQWQKALPLQHSLCHHVFFLFLFSYFVIYSF